MEPEDTLAPGPYPFRRTIRIVAKTNWEPLTSMVSHNIDAISNGHGPGLQAVSYNASCTEQGRTSQLPQNTHVSPCLGEWD